MVKVKVMYILTVNIFKTVTDWANMAIVIKYEKVAWAYD